MFNKLYNDVFLLILFNLTTIDDIISLSESSKCLNNKIDNYIYLQWGRYTYTNDFWNRALQRNPIVSKPLGNIKLELLRIKNFTELQIKNGHEPWNKKDYYKYWNSMENCINKQLQSNNFVGNNLDFKTYFLIMYYIL